MTRASTLATLFLLVTLFSQSVALGFQSPLFTKLARDGGADQQERTLVILVVLWDTCRWSRSRRGSANMQRKRRPRKRMFSAQRWNSVCRSRDILADPGI
jgi:hypothetical protein